MFQTLNTIDSSPLSIVTQNQDSDEQHNSESNQTFEIDSVFELECGKILNKLKINYSTYGTLNADASNVIWVCHALTADANPKEWWAGLVGEQDIYNPEEYFIVCANVIGSAYGSTSPLNCDFDKRYDHFPRISIRDNVNAFIKLRQHLKIQKIHTLIGGSMGGHQAMEWAIIEADVISHLILLATSAVMSPWATAFNQSQRLAILADSSYGQKNARAAQNGLKAARSIALLSYRNNLAYNQTQKDVFDFNRSSKAESYQDYQGDKLVARFNAYSYYALTKTMDSHDVGRNRGGIEAALRQIQAKTLVITITSDVLFPPEDSAPLSKFIPNAQLHTVDSDFGHDGFLIETQSISTCIEKFYQIQNNTGNIGLFGLGCVGQGIYQLLNDEPNKIKSIAVKHDFKARKQGYDLVTTNHHKVLSDNNIDTIIEAIDNEEHAYHIAKSAHQQGKHLISANKKMVANHMAEIISWNGNSKASFLYEAAVAGSIPILRNLDVYFDQSKTQSIRAILNGSSNYILTQMFKNKCSYEQALKQAQDLGFAETDPLADVGGFDAKYKAVILAVHAFGLLVHPDDVSNFSLQNISTQDIEFAKAHNFNIKQVVCIKTTTAGRVSITVIPELLKDTDELAKTDNENNAIIVHNKQTDFLFKGAGAGSIATATAITADLSSTEKNYQYQYKIDKNLKLDNDFLIKIYVSKKNGKLASSGVIIEETADYQIIQMKYQELCQIDTKQIFIAKIN